MLSAVLLAALGVAGSANAAAPVTWCGGAEQLSVDRPDTVNGLQWHSIDAVAQDSPDQFGIFFSGFASDFAGMDEWWTLRDPTRTTRLDLANFNGCAPGFEQLDISSVRLPRNGVDYQANATTVDRIKDDLNAADFGHPDKKYIVFYDGPYDDPTNCGKGITGRVDGGQDGYAIIFLSACSANPATGTGDVALTVTHEMIHAMNALPMPFPNPGPPNVCGFSQGGAEDLWHPCDSAADIMFPKGSPGDTFANQVLDLNRDDYYDHQGVWWDVQDSMFLKRLGSGDVTPPVGPNKKKVTAASVKRDVTFKWPRATGGGLLGYRPYTNGELFQASNDKFFTTGKRKIRLLGPKPKRVIELGVRTIDKAGNLGVLQEIRFKVGVGIVNAKGKLIKDTVPPSAPKMKPGSIGSAGLTLRWGKSNDLGRPINGYRVERNKRTFAILSPKARSTVVPFAKARGTWTVRAIDKPKNLSPRSNPLRIS